VGLDEPSRLGDEGHGNQQGAGVGGEQLGAGTVVAVVLVPA
jgi:hypothetical protein